MAVQETMTGKFGEAFPYKLVKSFIESPGKFTEVEGFINPDLFEECGLGLGDLVKHIKSFYNEKGVVPGYADLEYYIKDRVKDRGDLNAIYNAFKKVKEDKMSEGIDTAAETGIAFLKKMEALRQLKNAKTSVEKSGYDVDRIVRIIDGLQSIENGTKCEFFSPISILDKVFDEKIEETIPTGLDELDRQLKGGTPKGTTNLLLAGTGVGKTTLFSIMACKQVLMGKKVLYIYFEDKDTNFARKFYSVITGRYTSDFFKDSPKFPEAKKEMFDIFAKYPEIKDSLDSNHIRVMRLGNGDTTVDTIKSKIRQQIVTGWKPDVVFIDYLSCIKPSTDGKLSLEKEYAAYERAIKRLDSFAQDENFVLWVAQQFNREGCKFDSAYNRLGSIQGSYRVTQTASVIISLIRNTEDDDDYNRVNLYLDKSRFSELTQWEGIYMNNGTCQIDFSSVNRDLFGIERERNEGE